jgi:hypothetical protein
MNAPQPIEYQLEQTVVGKPDRREPVILEDKQGNKLKAPWAPNKKCKRCYGRGFTGLEVNNRELIPCRKCYPWKE